MTADRSDVRSTGDGITFYWRPGCGFCASLQRALESMNIPMDRHNIWENPDAAATVRSFARGNETVPTVVIGPIGLVNPSPQEVVAAMRVHTPELLPPELASQPAAD